jgi:hypothetical protein
MPSSSSENALIAAFLTKPVRPAAVGARKEPLLFTRRSKRPELFAGLPPEPEDAILTGATRSLYRRLLALNLKPAARITVASVTASILLPETRIA